MMQFKNCCCRYSLKSGSFTIGVVSAVSSLAALASAVALAYMSVWRTWEEGQRWADRARNAGLSEQEVQLGLREDFSSLTFVSNNIRVLLYLLGILEAFHFNFSLMLLFGIWKDRASYVRLWVRVSLVAIGLRFVFLLPIIIQVLMADFVQLGSVLLVFTMLSIPLAVYFILIVHSYHTKMMYAKLLKSYSDWPSVR